VINLMGRPALEFLGASPSRVYAETLSSYYTSRGSTQNTADRSHPRILVYNHFSQQ
jgi:hypothetical protein